MKQKLVLISSILSFGYAVSRLDSTFPNVLASVGSVGVGSAPCALSASGRMLWKSSTYVDIHPAFSVFVLFAMFHNNVQGLPNILLELPNVHSFGLLRVIHELWSRPF